MTFLKFYVTIVELIYHLVLDSMFNLISSYLRPKVMRHGTLMTKIASYSSDLLRTSRDSFESHLIFSFASIWEDLAMSVFFFNA